MRAQSSTLTYALIAALGMIALLLVGPGILGRILASPEFEPHGQCYQWKSGLVWLFTSSDTIIGLSYLAIAVTLSYLVDRAREDIPFHWMFLAFGTFIFACGLTHFMDVWTLYVPDFWLSGSVRVVTAVASVATAIALPPLVPKALQIVESAKLSGARHIQLERTNRELEREIAEHRQAQEEIKRLNAELEQRIRERTEQLNQLTAAHNELESFSYSVSHDLRAPLRSTEGFSQIMLEDYGEQLDEMGRSHLKRIQAASQRMGQIIDDLLALSQITRREMRIKPLNVSSMVEDIARELQALQPDREVEFVIQEHLSASADPRLLRVMLENLLINAWKFTGKQPSARIEFGTIEIEGQPVFFVRDNGAGFDTAYADKLFGVFQRLHSAGEFEGTGIGLATVQRVVQRHGGEIWAESEVGKGATFYFTLQSRPEQN